MTRDTSRFRKQGSQSTIEDVREIARKDPRWFIENYLKIAAKSREDVNLVFNHSQNQVWEDFEEARRNNQPVREVVLKSRQVGISTQMSGYVFADAWATNNTNALIVAHLKEVTTNLFKKQRKFYDCLPPEFRIPLDRANKNELLFEGINSTIILATAGTPHASRSQTLHDVLASEAAFYGDNLAEFRAAMEASVPKAAGTMIVYESTAYGSGTDFHTMYRVAKANDKMDETSSVYRARFLEWFTDPECSFPPFANDYTRDMWLEKVYAKAPFLRERGEHFGLTPEQIAWYYKTCQDNYSGDWLKMQQEFPCDDEEAFLSTGQTVIPVELIQKYKMFSRPGKVYDPTTPWTSWTALTDKELDHVQRDKQTYFEVWVPPQGRRYYLIAADTASGIENGDASCALVFDIATGNVVAVLHGRMEPKAFGKLLIKIGQQYNEALICPETDGLGVATLHEIKDSYTNIYQQRKSDGFATKITNKLGWDMTANLKMEIFSNLRRIMQERVLDADPGLHIPCAWIMKEMSTFTYSGGNQLKPKAERGCFDDRMVCLAIGAYATLEELRDNPSISAHLEAVVKPNRDEELKVKDVLDLVQHKDWTGLETAEELGGLRHAEFSGPFQIGTGGDGDDWFFGTD